MMLASITLPTGPYDWLPERMPREDYEARLSRVRDAMRARGATRLVVHGNWFDQGAVAWLTGFTPKLGPAYAFVALDGAPRVLFAGGPGMRPSAARLTWIEDVVASKGLDAGLKEWLGDASARVALCEGRGMSAGDFAAVQRAAGGAAFEFDAEIDGLRRAKTSPEMALIERASGALRAASDRMFADARDGANSRNLVLSSERAAYAAGAQDVRVRIGARPWGAPLIPGDGDDKLNGPTRVAMAVRLGGYWADASFVVGDIEPAVVAAVGVALRACLEVAKPGAGMADFAGAAGAKMRVHGIGLSPEEAPFLDEPAARLSAGDVCSVAVDVATSPAAWSMMIAVDGDGARVLWSPPGLDLQT